MPLRIAIGSDHAGFRYKEAIKTLRQWRFKPGMRLGQPVPVLILVEISFTLR